MFSNNDNEKFNLQSDDEITERKSFLELLNTKNSLIILGALLAIILIVFFILFFNKAKNTRDKIDDIRIEEKSENSGKVLLPGDLDENDSDLENKNTEDKKAEYLVFGNFYKENTEVININISDYDLPLNIKKDVINYYDISRKINLDSVTEDLNSKGFALINNPFANEGVNDFFSAYKTLDSKNIPILITNDFLYYYQQNIIKDAYKKIQRDIFYNNVWDIGKKLFNIADNRYRNNFAKSGIINDPVLESQRLEVLYFGVLLNLLQPLEKQINKKDNLGVNIGDLFTQTEVGNYTLNFPDYLRDDIDKEVKLIREAYSKTKSPTLLYEVDYSKYIVPEDYKKSAKLNNFYLASYWANSLFPLYSKDVDCEKCLLDTDDWLVNFMSACYISKDFSENQEIKNQWAKIYKFISFFAGLKSDLTYLHYEEALSELFGEDYEIGKIFAKDNNDKDENISLVREKIEEYKFLNLEGAFNRDNAIDKPNIGMRMLQESYWPNNYIFKKLIYPNIGNLKDKSIIELSNSNVTGCINNKKIIYRCRGFGLDIINLIYPIYNNAYFLENTGYDNYEKESRSLREEVSKFTINNWHKNNFWSTLYANKKLLETDESEKFVYEQNNGWKEKNLNTVLGSWVNMQVPSDEIATFIDVSSGFKEYKNIYNEYNYIEPNKNVILELEANTNMLFDMLESLNMLDETTALHVNFKALQKDLADFKSIVLKELEGNNLDENDWQIIADLATKYSVTKEEDKDFYVYFDDNGISKKISESIEGFKLLILIYKHEDKNVIAVGPVFNYQEK